MRARRVVSPNCNARPAGCVPDLIVLHGISLPPGEYGGGYIEALFTNTLDADAHPYFATIAELEVSAHFLIGRGGELVQFVPTDQRAWHAGLSCWRGREQCNDFSIGIELEGCDDQAYADEQYDALNDLLTALKRQYPTIGGDALLGTVTSHPAARRTPALPLIGLA